MKSREGVRTAYDENRAKVRTAYDEHLAKVALPIVPTLVAELNCCTVPNSANAANDNDKH